MVDLSTNWMLLSDYSSDWRSLSNISSWSSSLRVKARRGCNRITSSKSPRHHPDHIRDLLPPHQVPVEILLWAILTSLFSTADKRNFHRMISSLWKWYARGKSIFFIFHKVGWFSHGHLAETLFAIPTRYCLKFLTYRSDFHGVSSSWQDSLKILSRFRLIPCNPSTSRLTGCAHFKFTMPVVVHEKISNPPYFSLERTWEAYNLLKFAMEKVLN